MALLRWPGDYMNRPLINPETSSPKTVADGSQILHGIFFMLFVGAFGWVWLKTLHVLNLSGTSGWPEALMVLTAGLTTLVSLSRQLPGQNVLLAATIIALIAGVAQAVGAITGIPFGPYLYTDFAGPKMFKLLPWSIPAVWIIIILNARGVARLILRPWRKSRLYGFRLIGVTAALTLVFDFGLEPFATQVNEYWLWQPTKLGLNWQGAPLSNFLGWLVTALLILAFATPVLINKSHKKFPTDYHPLMMWLLLSGMFLTGILQHQLWLAAGVVALTTLISAVMAIHGARW